MFVMVKITVNELKRKIIKKKLVNNCFVEFESF